MLIADSASDNKRAILKKRRWRFLLAGINQLLWPAVCANCSEQIAEADSSLCSRCWRELLQSGGGEYCRRCGRDASEYGLVGGACGDCQGRQFHFDGIARAGVYSDSLKEMILSFKKGRADLDSVLGFLANSALEGGSFHEKVELFVPVPLHWSRRLVRGYNQSMLIVRKLMLSRGKINTELVRIRRTKLQAATSSFSARARNVAGAFAVRKGNPFTGRTICLVDDIKTSGATLNECARVLKEAGASHVFALVLAVAGQRTG